jgi:hypothetical protein
LRARFAPGELFDLPGCAYAPIYEKVEEFNAKTLAFLEQNTG